MLPPPLRIFGLQVPVIFVLTTLRTTESGTREELPLRCAGRTEPGQPLRSLQEPYDHFHFDSAVKYDHQHLSRPCMTGGTPPQPPLRG